MHGPLKHRRPKGWRGRLPAELLEERLVLAGEPVIVEQTPNGLTGQVVHTIGLEFSEPLSSISARDSASFRLTHLGVDRELGGGDDQVIPVLSKYAEGTSRIEISSVVDLSAWEELGYGFPPGVLGDWTLDEGGREVTQNIDGGITFFASDFDLIDSQFVGRFQVVEDSQDDDYIGLVFGLQTDDVTELPDTYYLVSWKQEAEAGAEGGLKLAKVTNAGQIGVRPDLWSLGASAQVEVLEEGPRVGWEPGSTYDFVVGYGGDGAIGIDLREVESSSSVWHAFIQDSPPIGSGRVGFYNFSQPGVTYTNLNFAEGLPDGRYQLEVLGGDPGLRDLEGNALDGNQDGIPGDDYVGTFEINTASASATIDLLPSSDSGVLDNDNITNVLSPTFAVAVNKIGLIEFDGNGDGTTDESRFANVPSTYDFTASITEDGSYSPSVLFRPASGDDVTSTIDVTIDSLGPTLQEWSSVESAPFAQWQFDFSEPINSQTLLPSDFAVNGPIFATQLIDNGSFENPEVPGLSWQVPGSLPGWESPTGLGSLNIHGTALWDAQDGSQHIEFDHTSSSLAQTVTNLQPGADYELVFGMAGNIDRAAVYGLAVDVSSSSETIASEGFSFDSTGRSRRDMGWTDKSLRFTATDPTAVFTFSRSDGGPSGWGPQFDNVRLRRVGKAAEDLTPDDVSPAGDQFVASFPPLRDEGLYEIAIQPGVQDLAGNAMPSPIVVSVEVSSDGFGPVVTDASLEPDQVTLTLVDASGLLASTVVDLSNYRLFASGGDGVLDDGSDIELTSRLAEPQFDPSTGVVSLAISPPLEDENYKIVVRGSAQGGISDDAGNLLNNGSDHTSAFLLNRTNAAVSLNLPSEFDSGQSDSDNITNAVDLTFEVSVNQAGILDLQIDGEASATLTMTGAGTHFLETSDLAEGQHVISAAFAPVGDPASAASVEVAVDLTPPDPLIVSSEVNAPWSSYQFGFSEPLALLSAEGVTLAGPLGPVSITALEDVDDEYRINFPPQTANGGYVMTISDVTDLAGNSVPEAVEFEVRVVADSTGPTVEQVTAEYTATNTVQELGVRFDELIQSDSFDAEDVLLQNPLGAIVSADQIEVMLVDESPSEYLVRFPEQSAEGLYVFAIGPGIEDLTGNPMSARYVGNFLVDTTGPQVLAVSPSGTVPPPTSSLEVVFSEPVFGFDATDVVLIGPDELSIALNQQPVLVSNATNTYSLTIPELTVEGSYELTIGSDISDVLGNTMSEPFQGAFTIAVPNLLLRSPDTLPSFGIPREAVQGRSLEMAWQIENLGEAVAAGTWLDRVWLSSDAILDRSGPNKDRLLAEMPAFLTPLRPGDSYTSRRSVDLPPVGTLAAGEYFIFLETGVGKEFSESNLEDNFTEPLPLTVVLPELPDLSVAEVSAPTEATPGELVTVQWVVENTNAAPAVGLWQDHVYLSENGVLLERLSTVSRTAGLAADGRYTAVADVQLPVRADGEYQLVVLTDANDEIFEGDREENNQGISSQGLALGHVDLVPNITVVPQVATSGDVITLGWTTTNAGSVDAGDSWVEQVWLVSDEFKQLVHEQVVSEPLSAGSVRESSTSMELPVNLVGELQIRVTTDALDEFEEVDGESNNTDSSPIRVDEAPYADLVVTMVVAQDRDGDVVAPDNPLIGDPARVTVEWTVTNQGVGVGRTTSWTDAVIVSTDDVLGNRDDVVLGTFARNGGLDVGQDYTVSESMFLPPGAAGRYHLFVHTDVDNVVYEKGADENWRPADALFDVMPIPYADLVIDEVTALPASVGTGNDLSISWNVFNRGIGPTNFGSWSDAVWLAKNPDGTDRALLGRFAHFGPLDVNGGYTRSVDVSLEEALQPGTYYVAVETGGPFEFIHSDKNVGVSAAVEVFASVAPDLAVTSVIVPEEAVSEGTVIDVTWTVENRGDVATDAFWNDRVFLRNTTDASVVSLGTFRNELELVPSISYTRSEAVRLPIRTNALYEVVVTTNFDAQLFETDTNSARNVGANNTFTAQVPIEVSVNPRPDLQVSNVVIPDDVDAGGAFSVEFTVINQGTVPTTTPRWTDQVFLSLDNRISSDDIRVASLSNMSALESFGDADGEDRYRQITSSVVVPERFRGEVYVITFVDAGGDVDEWPNDGNNQLAVPIHVNPKPFADLVVSDVVSDTLIVSGEQREDGGPKVSVDFTVTNLGAGETNVDRWVDQIWLTRDRDRPHPGRGDILLRSVSRRGSLAVNAGYDQSVTLDVPAGLQSGIYYITPWTDPYDQVLEDTLAANTNPDDPTEIDNNNFKARRVELVAEQPDLVITSVFTDQDQYTAGTPIKVDWSVINESTGVARPPGWIDRVYLSDRRDPFEKGARNMVLGEVRHDQTLAPGASYTESLPPTVLSPSAAGRYIVVVVDDGPRIVNEVREQNNQMSTEALVTPVPADLRVTNITVLPENLSGETTTIRYTVTNEGEHAVWPGTEYWTDFLWLSADPTFIRDRASFLGQVTTSHSGVGGNDGVLSPGESYEVTFETTLPKGTDGEYFVYVDLDAHNDLSCFFDPFRCRLLLTDWWPANSGGNSAWLSHFRRWAHEDPFNNRAQQPITITYQEPDLQVTELVVPSDATSGQTIPISFTVTNEGNRDTRQSGWIDRVFLSKDASLDEKDLLLGESSRQEVLATGDSYATKIDVRLPDSIEGSFHVLVYTDSSAKRAKRVLSDIGFNLKGVEIEGNNPLDIFDLASVNQRSLGRGAVPEFQHEANNIADRELPIALAVPPDLQVTEVIAPDRVVSGQEFEFEYTVTNAGGATPSTQASWQDYVYFSRDDSLDIRADRFLNPSQFEREKPPGGLGPGESYTGRGRVRVPTDLDGPYYFFVVTDPVRSGEIGDVFELDQERNNSRARGPLQIDQPPPSDIEVTAVEVPDSVRAGDPVSFTWTVKNLSENTAQGSWSDSVFLSQDAMWDINDVPVGRQSYSGRLELGDDYSLTLNATMPAVTPGQYRVIVRTDIFNELYEDQGDENNATASEEPFEVTVEELALGVKLDTTLSTGQTRLFQVRVPEPGRTLRVRLSTDSNKASNELFLRHGFAPTTAGFDAAYSGGLSPTQTAVIPSTEPGIYYVLVHGYSEPNPNTPVTLLAELVPLSITNVYSDVGGAVSEGSGLPKYVTTTIEGAEFDADARIKLVRPGFGEFDPVVFRVVDKTKIVATFDFSDAPKGPLRLEGDQSESGTGYRPLPFSHRTGDRARSHDRSRRSPSRLGWRCRHLQCCPAELE